MTTRPIPPHGGVLINRFPSVDGPARDALRERARALPALVLGDRAVCDLECIATGVYSPLEGFLGEEDHAAVVATMRLSSGVLWSIPIALRVSEDEAQRLGGAEEIALLHADGRTILATMRVVSRFRPDREAEAKAVYGTADRAHPGVAALMEEGAVCLGGPITAIDPVPHAGFGERRLTPLETRAEFARRGWKTVVAFQTRNPIHRAHEYLTKVALESADGLLVHPLVGATKSDDVPAVARMRAYEALLAAYYPKDRTMLAVHPAAMRYAGPREAILHAISRQNHGCTHFIVGRDHAGAGNFYGPLDAQRIFERLGEQELAIRIVKFENSFWCRACGAMASEKTCPHGAESRMALSGTKVREMLARGERLPEEFTRPEVAGALSANAASAFAAASSNGGGFTVWLTGLSGAGKTTIADLLGKELRARGLAVETLDGDVVRSHLSKGLGFSKEDRDTNIRRIGFVAGLLARNGVATIVAAISPYRAVREEVRTSLGSGSFVEVFVDAPVEVCEKRDTKGLYAKARAGEIKGFTGIDDPYEAPERADVTCRTADEPVEVSVGRILDALERESRIPAIRRAASAG